MPPLDAFGLDYLRLVLEIDAHHMDGYVDSYYGPDTIKAEVEAAPPQKPEALLATVADLQARIPDVDPVREQYLRAELRAIECTVRMLNHETFDYLDEVYHIYDVRPTLVDDSRFEATHRELDRVLPAGKDGATLAERLDAWHKRFEIAVEKALPLLELVRAETYQRTTTLIDLPYNESIEVTLVRDRPWGAYNWYLGNGQSLIEFNTDIPLQATSLLGTFAHEGYPGHHTEAMLKERALYLQKGYAEQAAMRLHSPAAVIAEGIATTALDMIFPGGEHHQWNAEFLFPAAGIAADGTTAETLHGVSEAGEALRYVTGNAAILYHTGQINREQAIEYIRTYGLATAARAAKSFDFLSHPLYRSYIFTYSIGHDLIMNTADPVTTFRRLLTEQVLPSHLITL